MVVVPVVRGRDLFTSQIAGVQTIGGLEFDNRLIDFAGAPQLVTEHMPRVRHLRGHRRVGFGLHERLVDAAGVFERVREVVPRGEVRRRERQRALEEARRADRAALSAIRRVGRLGDATLQPELLVGWKRLQRCIHGFPIGGELDCVAGRLLGGHLRGANGDVTAIVLGRAGPERLRAFEGGLSVRWRVQLGVRIAEADLGHRQRRIEPPRLVKRARRFDPYVRV